MVGVDGLAGAGEQVPALQLPPRSGVDDPVGIALMLTRRRIGPHRQRECPGLHGRGRGVAIEARGQSFTGSVSIHDWLGVPRDSPGVGERGVEVVVGLVEQGPGSVQLVGGSERGAVPGEVVAVIVLCPVPVGEVSIGELV